MISFPTCKINIGLRILNQREDGYHNLVSVFYPVQWCDALEIVRSNEFGFQTEGIMINGSNADNICVKAYNLLQQLYELPPVKMVLLKNIPIGAGLGGGSSDGAFTLKMLNEFFELHITNGELKAYALQLGSDCPFFIENKPMFVTGKGEQLAPVEINLSGYCIVILYPEIAVNTAWAFQEYSKANNSNSAEDDANNFTIQLQQPVSSWKDIIVNDFEAIVIRQHPEIEALKKQLYASGALYASMSGSGSAVYGIFQEKPEQLSFIGNNRSYIGTL
ncbi:MAG: 4-(cytidine 5'-diphospho)-2-C-methyl-D-erythritol kinase [Chitinophagales bacterium]